jgi:hypothetical protein
VSLENIIVGEIEKTEVTEKMKSEKKARERRQRGYAILFDSIDSKLKNVRGCSIFLS